MADTCCLGEGISGYDKQIYVACVPLFRSGYLFLLFKLHGWVQLVFTSGLVMMSSRPLVSSCSRTGGYGHADSGRVVLFLLHESWTWQKNLLCAITRGNTMVLD